MSEHELWNELGNLYFMTGTYSQAAYAYNRSIQMDSGFGRPYCNLALTYVKQGRYAEAVGLYQRSIDLLVDEKEKAITWYRLGDVYRHLKDYRDAIMAYQQADILDPQISQERKESDQILYGGSGAQARQDSPLKDEVVQAAAHVPAPPVEGPPTLSAEIQAAPQAAELPVEERIPAPQEQEVEIASAPLPEPAADEAVIAAQDEALQVESPAAEKPVNETIAVSEAEDALIVPEEPQPQSVETVAVLGNEAGQGAFPMPELTVDELIAQPPVDEIEVMTPAQEPLADELVAVSPETVASPSSMEPATDEIVSIFPDEEVTAEVNFRAELADEAPVVVQEPELSIETLPEEAGPEPATMIVADPIPEDPAVAAETFSDTTDSGWGEDTYPDFEHETEVFLPEPVEDDLDHWLPIPQSESLPSAPTDFSDTVLAEDPGLVVTESTHYAEPVRLQPQPLQLPQQSHAPEMSMSAAKEVDVDVLDNYAETVFIIPGDQQEVEEARPITGESNEDEPVETLSPEQDEELKEVEQEIVRFRQVVQANPRNSSAWDTLGTLYKSARRYRDAILAYQQAVVADPSKAPYHHHLGIIYAVEGRDEDAIKAFQDVIEMDPNHSLAHASLGGYYRRMGLEELAQKHIGKAMKNFYTSENEYNRACLEALCGNTEQSIELLRVALKNKQTYVDWVLRDPDLDSIRRDPRFKQLISDYTA